MRRFVLSLSLLVTVMVLFGQGKKWSEERANNWYKAQPWYCGINYIPSDAINYTAMWDKTSYNPRLIDKELALAQSIGLNCARVVLQYAVYAENSKYFLRTLDNFLAICDRHKIKVIPAFFDDCSFGASNDPVTGKQPEPLEGWYAWAWSPSPGHTMVIDVRTHPLLEKYVKEVMAKFKNDRRIFAWDLYNEPTNSNLKERSFPLLKSTIAWAREIDPSQPLTIAMFNENKDLNDIIIANSDIITFHCYNSKEETAAYIKRLKVYNRPVICTEWMNRPRKSTVEDVLPLFREQNVGNILWGLVNGKTQTHLPWGFRPEKLPYTGVWQHDLFTKEFVPYKQEEINLIKKLAVND